VRLTHSGNDSSSGRKKTSVPSRPGSSTSVSGLVFPISSTNENPPSHYPVGLNFNLRRFTQKKRPALLDGASLFIKTRGSSYAMRIKPFEALPRWP
jgi:hypothetical protein